MRDTCLPPEAVSAATETARAPAALRSAAGARRGAVLKALSGLVFAGALSACTVSPPPEAPTTRASSAAIALPLADPTLGARDPVPRAGLPSNAALTRDFLELSFALESGRALPRFTRFEGPISITLSGPVPATAPRELERLVARLRSEAGLDISTGAGAANRITVEFVPKRQMQAEVPNAACFVVPNVTGWADYRAARRTPRADWAALATRTAATVFVPSDSAPQEVRDCLHEEISQALGPLNDLYRLPDTVWNDDNFHTVLTRYDMTILRASYAPELRSGMSQPEVAAALPKVFARINPAGGAVAHLREDPTPRPYIAAIERALGAKARGARRTAAAQEAVQIAAGQGWTDTRAGFAWFALGRLSMKDDPQTALRAFLNAGAIYRATPGAGIQAAHVDMQLAAFALSAGRAQDAIALVNRSLSAALEEENAALMATLYLIRAEAYETLGHTAEAAQARLDSAQWARYGFGSDAAVRARAAEVAALADAGARMN